MEILTEGVDGFSYLPLIFSYICVYYFLARIIPVLHTVMYKVNDVLTNKIEVTLLNDQSETIIQSF
jgi:hypothetical protein